MNWIFLGAYACSGFAGLVYQLAWTRLLTLQLGHTTAAASTVIAAFMGGLGGGAAIAAWIAPRLSPRDALRAYVGLEAAVVLLAFALPFELGALTGLLAPVYRDGASAVLFPLARVAACLVLVTIPALALGATFPVAVRWYAGVSSHPGRISGSLYAANTVGATGGVLAAGFMAIPAIGVSATTGLGMLASGIAIAGVVVVARRADVTERSLESAPSRESSAPGKHPGRRTRKGGPRNAPAHSLPERPWLAAAVLGLTGFAGMTFEIAWIRVLSLLTGPTTYAVAATLAAVIGGMACGSAFGSWIAGRSRQAAAWLAFVLVGTALATAWTTSLAGTAAPRAIADIVAGSSDGGLSVLDVALVAALILPTATGLGMAFPLALEIAGGQAHLVARRAGIAYVANTLAAVAGALAAGFAVIPAWGLRGALHLAAALPLAAGAAVLARARLPPLTRAAGLVPAGAVVVLLAWGAPWDRELLAGGVYKYAAAVPPGVSVDSALRAGTLLYYREGAAATVSVRRQAGARSLAIDGKVDASTAGDMLTQKLLAHLPLLLHPDPRDVLIVGLGSGVTLASALTHPVASVDVVEISPEVVEASAHFAAENGRPLDDPRSRLILGDGRSHLELTSRRYDVIVSEPSNPWMAGVAALFTQEFFASARNRLAPGGIICQWAHTYDITDADLRSIVATFRSVFPSATAWLIGRSDLLLVASLEPLDGRLDSLAQRWKVPEVAADLATASVVEPFALLSLFAGGPEDLERYSSGAPLQVDDRMALEFSGPRAINLNAADANANAILAMGERGTDPPAVRDALAAADARQWRQRASMMLGAEDYPTAFEDYSRALALDPTDEEALDGLVRTAVATGRDQEASNRLRSLLRERPRDAGISVAASRLLAATGDFDEAIRVALEALEVRPDEPAALQQLASIFADLGDGGRLCPVAARLEQVRPEAPKTPYYAGACRFLSGDLQGAALDVREAIARDPRDASAHNLLGIIDANLNRAESARAAFETALRLDPRNSTAYLNLGLQALSSGNAQAAAGYFTEALLLDPESGPAREGLAQARQALSRDAR